MSLLKVIREKCLECCCQSSLEVRLCGVSECPLHPYRFGKKPLEERKKISQEQLDKLRQGRLNKNKEN